MSTKFFRPHNHHLRPPSSKHRVIIALDFDCFYASVAIRDRPHLVDKPVAIVQKHLCVTTNYVARRPEHGSVKKMTPVSEAQKRCPDLVLIDGSDLSPFRTANREILSSVRVFISQYFSASVHHHCPVERLGFDEVFVDVTTLVNDENVLQNTPWTFQGHVFSHHQTSNNYDFDNDNDNDNDNDTDTDTDNDNTNDDDEIRRKLMIGSHIANNLRKYILQNTKLSCCAGVANSKLLAKVASGLHKPDAQTTVLSGNSTAAALVSPLQPRALPWLGTTTFTALQSSTNSGTQFKCVGDLARTFPLSTEARSMILIRNALSRSNGYNGVITDDFIRRLIRLFHGIDDTNVSDNSFIIDGNVDKDNQKQQQQQQPQVRDVPKSISVEDGCRSCKDLYTVRNMVNKLAVRLVLLLVEDYACSKRRAQTVSVGFRFRTAGFKTTWKAARAPIEVTGTRLERGDTTAFEKVRRAVKDRMMSVLRENVGVGITGRSYDLTLIGVGVSNFTDSGSNSKSITSMRTLTTAQNNTNQKGLRTMDIASFFSGKGTKRASKEGDSERNEDPKVTKVAKTNAIVTGSSGSNSFSLQKRRRT